MEKEAGSLYGLIDIGFKPLLQTTRRFHARSERNKQRRTVVTSWMGRSALDIDLFVFLL